MRLIEWDNIVVNIFDDGTADFQTFIDVDKDTGPGFTLRAGTEIRPDGTPMNYFPFWDVTED